MDITVLQERPSLIHCIPTTVMSPFLINGSIQSVIGSEADWGSNPKNENESYWEGSRLAHVCWKNQRAFRNWKEAGLSLIKERSIREVWILISTSAEPETCGRGFSSETRRSTITIQNNFAQTSKRNLFARSSLLTGLSSVIQKSCLTVGLTTFPCLVNPSVTQMSFF